MRFGIEDMYLKEEKYNKWKWGKKTNYLINEKNNWMQKSLNKQTYEQTYKQMNNW